MNEAKPPEADANKPLLLFFFDPTCGLCRRTEAHIAQVLQRRSNHETFRLYRVHHGRRPDLQSRLHVTGVPTICVVKNKRLAARLERPRNARQIRELLAPWLK